MAMVSRRTFVTSAAAAIAASPVSAGNILRPGLGQVPPDRFDPWIELDARALGRNVETVARLSAGRPIRAVLKNNAYGLGLREVARLLEPMAAIGGYAVVRADEAIALREAGTRKPVLLMARAATGEIGELVDRNIELSVFADDDPARLRSAAGDRAIEVQLYIDTGLGRMGVPHGRASSLARAVQRTRNLRLVGCFTTLTESPDFDLEQLRRFSAVADAAKREGIGTGNLHAASSNGVYHVESAHLDMVRPGIALYGAYPSRPDEERAKAPLDPVCRFRARLVRTQLLSAGDSVGYGRRYVAERPTWIATLPVGHADGYPGRASNGAHVYMGERLYRVIAVTASHTVIELGDDERGRVGDAVTLMGPDDPAIEPNAIAATIGVSAYDLLMHMREGLPRYTLQG
jgi:alanine racemase